MQTLPGGQVKPRNSNLNRKQRGPTRPDLRDAVGQVLPPVVVKRETASTQEDRLFRWDGRTLFLRRDLS